MPTYEIDWTDGHTYAVDSETELTDEQVVGALQAQLPKTTAVGTTAREAAIGVLPALASAGGWAAAAALAPETGALSFLIPAAAAGISALGTGYLQRKGIEVVAPQFARELQAGEQEHPVAAFAGRIAAPGAVFKVAPGLAARGLILAPKVLRGAGSEVEQAIVKTAGLQAGLGAGMAAIGPAVEGRLPTGGELAEGAAQAMLYGQPRIKALLPRSMRQAEIEGGQDAIQDLTAVQKPGTLEYEKPNIVQTGTQAKPGIYRETTPDTLVAIQTRIKDTSDAWLEGIARNDPEASANAASEIVRSPMPNFEQSQEWAKILVDPNLAGEALRASSDYGIRAGQAAFAIGTRPPQKQQYPGQPTGKPEVAELRGPQPGTLEKGETRETGAIKKPSQIETSAVVQASQLLRDLSDPQKQARSARNLLRLLQEEIPGLPKETIDEIRRSIYATIFKRIATSLSLEVPPGRGAEMVGQVRQPETPAVSQAQAEAAPPGTEGRPVLRVEPEIAVPEVEPIKELQNIIRERQQKTTKQKWIVERIKEWEQERNDSIDFFARRGIKAKGAVGEKAEYGLDTYRQIMRRPGTAAAKLFKKEGGSPLDEAADEYAISLGRITPEGQGAMTGQELLETILRDQQVRDNIKAKIREEWDKGSEEERAIIQIEQEKYIEKYARQRMEADDPGVYEKIESEAKEQGQKIKLAPEQEAQLEAEQPFAGGRFFRFMTIDPTDKTIVIYPRAFSRWYRSIPENLREASLRSRIAEEGIHLKVKPDDALGYWQNLTAVERWIEGRLYRGETNPTLMGHEAIRRRVQRLMEMDSSEVAETAGFERWSLRSLEYINDVIRKIRETLGTKASQEQLAILSKVQGNMQTAIAVVGQQPAARTRKPIPAQIELGLKPAEPGVERGPPVFAPITIARTAQVADEVFASETRPSFDRFQQVASERFEGVHRGQLRDAWEDAVWKNLLSMPGEQLAKLRNSLGLARGEITGISERNRPVVDEPPPEQYTGFRLEREPTGRAIELAATEEASRRAIPRSEEQRYRNDVISRIAQKLIAEAETGAKPWSRKSISADEIAFDRPTREGAYRTIAADELGNAAVLGRILTDRAGVSRAQETTQAGVAVRKAVKRVPPEGVTRRVTALYDRSTGQVHLVSTYATSDKPPIVRLVDPALGHLTRQSVPLSPQFLRRYRPFASILIDEPVQNFRQTFKNIREYNDTIGTPAKQQASKMGEYEPPPGAPEVGAEETTYKAPYTERDIAGMRTGPGILEQRRRALEDAEAGRILDHINDEAGGFTSPDDIEASFADLRNRPIKNADVRSAYIKLYNEIRDRNPKLTPDEAYEKLKTQIFEDATQTANRDEFVARTTKRSQEIYGEPPGRGVSEEPEGVELTTPERAPIEGGPVPPSEAPAVAPEPTTGFKTVGLGQVEPAVEKRPPSLAQLRYSMRWHQPAARYQRRRTAREMLVKLGGTIESALKRTSATVARAPTKANIAAGVDASDNMAHNFANRIGNYLTAASGTAQRPRGDVEMRAGVIPMLSSAAWSKDAEGNWTFDNSKINLLKHYENQVAQGEKSARALLAQGGLRNTYVGRRWLAATQQLKAEIEYARAHWADPDFRDFALEARDQLDAQIAREQQAGRQIEYDEGYVPGRYEGEFFGDNEVRFGQPYVLGRQFGKPKTFPSYYDAIANGPYIGVSRDIASIVSHRVRQGMRRINESAQFQHLRNIIDPVSKKPIAVSPKIVNRGINPATGKPMLVSVAPSVEHEIVDLRPGGAESLAVRKGYSKFIKSLYADSWVQATPVPAFMLHTEMALKHSLLAADIFHLMRLTYYGGALMKGKMGHRGGLSVLDWNPRDYAMAVRQGMLRQKDVDWANQLVPWGRTQIPRHQLADIFEASGLNIGRIQDALYKDIVSGWPIIGPVLNRWNRWLFDKYTRGLMMQSAINAYEKGIAKHAGNSAGLVRQISNEINVMFGSLGRQSWFAKSRTAQDISRLGFLAPQWVEGLLRKEIGLVTSPLRLATGRSTVLGETIGAGILGMIALTQGINLITRGKPTWMNEEEGHKMDAWLPDITDPKGPGFFFSPLSVFAELSHDMVRLLETKENTFEAAKQIGENKLSPWGRVGLILATQTTPYKQRITSTVGVGEEVAKQFLPVPIAVGRLSQAGASALAPSLVSPPPPGSVQRQTFSTFGLKIEPSATDVQQIGRMAERWKKENGLSALGHEFVMTDEPSYSKLRAAARNKDQRAFHSNAQALLKTKTPNQILEAMNLWARRPFTGSQMREMQFLSGLDQKGLDLWSRANEQRLLELQAFIELFQKEF